MDDNDKTRDELLAELKTLRQKITGLSSDTPEQGQNTIHLRALDQAARAITAELSLDQVLQKIVEATRELLQVKYVALGVHNGRGGLSEFITTGLDPAAYQQIRALPTGKGLLGLLLKQGKSMIVNDIPQHPDADGFPAHHPSMQRLLGVPIISKKRLIGTLYLADKTDETDFTIVDRQMVEQLALHAAIAIDNARLHQQVQQLAVLEERDRFARDLHDGIIQSIYAVGLTLDQVKLDITPGNTTALTQIEVSLKSLAGVIQDIRNYIFDLRPHALRNQGLKSRLEGLLKEVKTHTSLPIDVFICPDIDAHLSDWQAGHIFHIGHEALSNAINHAKPAVIHFELTCRNNIITLGVKDDGIGFIVTNAIKPGHYGLANIYARAQELSANLDITSIPEQGTCITLTLNNDLIGTAD